MRNIGLIGITSDGGVLDYYQQIQNTIQNRSFTYGKGDILIYTIKLYEEEDSTIGRLCDVYFYMMRNHINAILFCHHQLQLLSQYLNMPGAPLLLDASIAVTAELKKSGLKKVLLFDLTLTPELGYCLKGLKKEEIIFVVLSEQDRNKIKSFLNREPFVEKLSEETITFLNRLLAQLPFYGIQGILIDSPDLNLIMMHLHTELPCFYIWEIHINQAVDFLFH